MRLWVSSPEARRNRGMGELIGYILSIIPRLDIEVDHDLGIVRSGGEEHRIAPRGRV